MQYWRNRYNEIGIHYLNVWTIAGRTTVSGNLKNVCNKLKTLGMQIYHSHWVAHKYMGNIVGET